MASILIAEVLMSPLQSDNSAGLMSMSKRRILAQGLPLPIPFRVRLNEVPDEQWHAMMTDFRDIHYEQTAVYPPLRTRERDGHILISEQSEIVAGARVGILKVPLLNRGLALVRFGPFWRRCGKEPDLNAYREIMRRLIEEYCERQKLYLIVRPRAHPVFYHREAEILQELGVIPRASTLLDRFIIDVSLSEEEQMKSLDQGWRAKLRKALRDPLEIKMSDDTRSVEVFQQLYARMVARKKLNYSGVDLVNVVRRLIALPAPMRLQVAMAYRDGAAVGGATFAVLGDMAYYVFGASTPESLQAFGGYLLQWQIIRRLKDSGVQWYELGGPGDGGIRQFKKGLAGKRGVFLPAQEFHYCTDWVSSRIVNSLFRLRALKNAVQQWRRGSLHN